MKLVAITEQQAQEILTYLSTQPAGQVYRLVSYLLAAVPADEKPEPTE